MTTIMKSLSWKTVIVMLAGAMLVACSTVKVGQNFDLNAFADKVERGVTTQNQVRGWLGAPHGVGVNVDTGGERFEEWSYYYAAGNLPAMKDLDLKLLQIKFDQYGIVRGYNWSGNP
jgi:outer membrane protein assembly factor BamE (lipoprotein component of BamABCDE complex)